VRGDALPLLADGAPDGTGLAIVGLILLVFLAVAVGLVTLVVVLVVRAVRRRRAAPPPGWPPTPPA
jgi:heme/copper-type cytochrome/quinol oxidase subunit 2